MDYIRECMADIIPRYPLKHKEEIVSFAIRTLEEVYDEGQGKTDGPHRHGFYTMLWIKQGRGVHHIDFRDYMIESNTVHFIRPGQVHQFVPESRPMGVAVLFTDDFLNLYGISRNFFINLYLFEDCNENTPVTLDKEGISLFEELSYTMFKELEDPDTYSYEVIGANLKLLLICCQRVKIKDATINDQNVGNSLVRDFKLAVEEKFYKLHKVSDYAEELYVTANHMNQVIKSALGITAKEYIQNRIILEAKREAQFTGVSGKEIAFHLGFEDPAHFSKFFRNCTGQSFSSFRDQIHKKYN